MGLKHGLRKLLWKIGYDIGAFSAVSHPLARRRLFFQTYDIDTVLDIGANAGQFALELRNDLGYRRRILSFEPLSSAFGRLAEAAKGDAAWEVFNFAVGERSGRQEINVSGNSYSSSLLEMLPSHRDSAPTSRYVGKEVTEVRTVDSFFGELCRSAKSVYMKIDTQGYESRVLRGAEASLPRIDTVQIEMSLVPLYEGEVLFWDMWELMRGKGYTLIAIENGFSAATTGQLLQVDGLFHRFSR